MANRWKRFLGHIESRRLRALRHCHDYSEELPKLLSHRPEESRQLTELKVNSSEVAAGCRASLALGREIATGFVLITNDQVADLVSEALEVVLRKRSSEIAQFLDGDGIWVDHESGHGAAHRPVIVPVGAWLSVVIRGVAHMERVYTSHSYAHREEREAGFRLPLPWHRRVKEVVHTDDNQSDEVGPAPLTVSVWKLTVNQIFVSAGKTELVHYDFFSIFVCRVEGSVPCS